MAGIEGALRRHRRIGLDSSVFVYHLEAATRFADPAGVALSDLARGAFDGVTSVLTIMEITVKPLQIGRDDIADEYDILLASYPHLMVIDLDRTIARRAAELRATYRLRPADALQVAACLEHGATAFLTNDNGLRRITDLEVLLLADFVGPV